MEEVIRQENARKNEQPYLYHTWIVILTKTLGELQIYWIERRAREDVEMLNKLKAKLAQIAAVAVCMMTQIDKQLIGTETVCQSCGNRPGVERTDNGLPAGIHCDTCWDKLTSTARQRSW